MKFHVQFLDTSIVDKNMVVEACGSDAVFILDGRNPLSTMIADAQTQMHRLRNVHKYVGFVIKQGSRFGHCKCIHSTH